MGKGGTKVLAQWVCRVGTCPAFYGNSLIGAYEGQNGWMKSSYESWFIPGRGYWYAGYLLEPI